MRVAHLLNPMFVALPIPNLRAMVRPGLVAVASLGVAGFLLSPASAKANTSTGPVINPANGHSYYLLSQNTWTASQAEAVGLGGHLATINNAAENLWVTSTFSNFGGIQRALWIGLNDAASEGSFVWVSGEPLIYTNWGPSEPNDHLGEDWVHIFPTTDGRFPAWNDAPNQANAFGFRFHGVVEVAPIPEPSTIALVVTLAPLLRRRLKCR